jgi:hypothetical protein
VIAAALPRSRSSQSDPTDTNIYEDSVPLCLILSEIPTLHRTADSLYRSAHGDNGFIDRRP